MWTMQWTGEAWFMCLHYFQMAVYDVCRIGIPDGIWTVSDRVTVAVLLTYNM